MQHFDKQSYAAYAKRRAGRSPVLKNSIAAFLTGGTLCLLGELLFSLYERLGADTRAAGLLVTLSLIFLSSLLTFWDSHYKCINQ